MKHLTRNLLHLVLTLATMGVLLTTALATNTNTDTLTLNTYPEGGTVIVSSNTATGFSVLPTLTNTDGESVSDEYVFSYIWQLNNTLVSHNMYYEFPANMQPNSYVLTCFVTATHVADHTTKTAQVTWYPSVQNRQDISLTVSENLGNYYFTSTDTQDGSSVYSKIYSALDIRSNTDLSTYQISFSSNVSDIAAYNGKPLCSLRDLNDAYLSIYRSGTWVTQYTVTQGDTVVLSGLLSIVIEPHIGMDAFYTAAPGESITIPTSDFYNFWYESLGAHATLQSVYITGCTGVSGVLCYDHTSSERGHTNAYGLVMYTSPQSSSQKALDALTFIPNKSANKYPSGTLTLTFTANGMDQNRKSVSVTGSFVIFYTTQKVESLTYNCTGAYVLLNSSDFDAVYRTVTGSSTKNPSYTVRFLDVPAFGTLYRGYSSGSYGTLGSTPLTNSNLATMTFSSNSTGENSLDKLAYVPAGFTSTGDSVRYVVYSGTKLLYVGTVNFTSRELVITYTTSSPTLNFSSNDFYTSDSPLLNAQYLIFGTPSSGALYKDYTNGIRVQSSDYFSYNTAYGVSLLDNVTFVPKAGFSGVVEIPFAGHSLLGGTISGKVRIYVTRNDVFTDVSPDLWAAPYINRLYAEGIISGTSATTFSPDTDMTYGAALKMILVAAGYPKQSETSGSHWASNYLSLAYRNGIVSSTNINLDAAVDRNTIAEIAAKALGLDKASSINAGIIAPVDSTNGYVYALYNAGIINGSFDSSGYNHFYGSKSITRAEVAKIICMISDYNN